MTKSNKLLSISAIFIIIALLLAIMSLIWVGFTACAQSNSSYVLIDACSGVILLSDNADARLEPASTTKIMTALVALENCNLDDKITVPDEAVGVEGSSIYLKKGEVISYRTLIYGLMLRSGNDAAVALAKCIGGSVDEFVKMMNDRCISLGLSNTHFDNPHGLHSATHYTSARDLAMIAREAYRNDEFVKIASSKVYKSGEDSETQNHIFYNKNKLLSNYNGANGVKTGYTTSAGKCFVGAAKRDDMQLISVVLNRGDMWQKSKELLDYGFDNFKSVKLVGDEPFADYVYDGERVILAAEQAAYYPIKRGLNDDIRCKFQPLDSYPQSIQARSVVGHLAFYIGNRLIFRSKVITINMITNKGASSLPSFVDCEDIVIPIGEN